MPRRRHALPLLAALACAVLAGCGGGSSTAASAAFGISVDWTTSGTTIARAHTCDGADTRPTYRWHDPPAGTKAVVIVVVDDSASGFVHDVVAGLPPSGTLGPGPLPAGVTVGVNGFGKDGWSGPCPPRGAKAHVYRVIAIALSSGFAINGHRLADLAKPLANVELGRTTASATYARA